MEAEDKPKKAKKAAPVDKACKYVEILLNQRPKLTKSKRKKKKAELPKLEKVIKDYDLKVSFRERNVEYFEQKIARYQQFKEHLNLVRSGLNRQKLDSYSKASIEEDPTGEAAAKESVLPAEERKKVRAARRFRNTVALENRLFTAYRRLNSSGGQDVIEGVLKGLDDKEAAS